MNTATVSTHTFKSASLGTEVRVVYELDDEPSSYQFGVVGADIEMLEVWIGSWDAGMHLSDSSLGCIKAELCREVL